MRDDSCVKDWVHHDLCELMVLFGIDKTYVVLSMTLRIKSESMITNIK